VAKSLQQLKFAIWVNILLTWSAVAYAAENPFVAGVDAIPLKAIVYVLALAFVGGLAGTLTKLAKPDVIVRNLPLEISKDMVSSIVSGILAFLFSSYLDNINFWLQAAFITIAGYGGSKVLDMALADGLTPFLQRVFGKVQKTGGDT
jgi:hypothetical protein